MRKGQTHLFASKFTWMREQWIAWILHENLIYLALSKLALRQFRSTTSQNALGEIEPDKLNGSHNAKGSYRV